MGQRESKLSREIMDALTNRGAFVWKNHGGPTMMAGLPDICGVWRGLMIGIETKMPGEESEVSAIQRRVHTKMGSAGAHVLAPCTSVAQAVAWMTGLPWAPPGTGRASVGDLAGLDDAIRERLDRMGGHVVARVHEDGMCWCGDDHDM
jgi:hypothetical protein